MIADLKPYPEYKDSGLPWLGEVPGHWQILRLKSAAKILMGQSPSSQDCSDKPIGAPFLQGCAEFGVRTPKPRQFCSSAPKIAPSGAILLSVRAPVGRLNLSDQEYGIGRGLCAVVPQQAILSVPYARYSIEAGVDGLMVFSTGSTYGAVSVGDVGVQPFPLPPLEEQAGIVRFLDWANGRLERAIRAKRKVIALLNEQKQAIIHRAVTRGLDPTVPLKDSGIPWLGQIPAHWEVRRLGRLARVFNGTTPSRAVPSYWSNGSIPWLSSGKVNDHVINTPSELITARALAECSLSIVPSGALLMGLIGQGRTRGMCALLAIDACISQNLAAVVPGPVLSNQFLYFALVACYDDIREFGRGGNQAALNCEIVGRLPIPVPPLEEQTSIGQSLSSEISQLLPVENTIKREIELLREYRTRLVADVVTGKLDVREAATRLPDELTPDSIEDDALSPDDLPEDAELQEMEA